MSQGYKFIFLFKKVQPEEMKMQGVFFCLLTVDGDMIQRFCVFRLKQVLNLVTLYLKLFFLPLLFIQQMRYLC